MKVFITSAKDLKVGDKFYHSAAGGQIRATLRCTAVGTSYTPSHAPGSRLPQCKPIPSTEFEVLESSTHPYAVGRRWQLSDRFFEKLVLLRSEVYVYRVSEREPNGT